MTHELKLLFDTLKSWQLLDEKAVFVSVVDLEGSSYRRPGVRMLIREDGEYAGAVFENPIKLMVEGGTIQTGLWNDFALSTYSGIGVVRTSQ